MLNSKGNYKGTLVQHEILHPINIRHTIIFIQECQLKCIVNTILNHLYDYTLLIICSASLLTQP